MREGLSASELGVRWPDGAGCREDGAVAFQHHETGVLVRQPTQCGERHHSVWADHHKAAQAVTDTRKAVPPTVNADAIFKKQMSTIHADLDAIAVKSDDTVSRN